MRQPIISRKDNGPGSCATNRRLKSDVASQTAKERSPKKGIGGGGLSEKIRSGLSGGTG